MMMRTIKINYLTLLKTKLNKYIIYCGTCNVKYKIDIYCRMLMKLQIIKII